jgi:enoyl-CoA hydratase/carnithine racemase
MPQRLRLTIRDERGCQRLTPSHVARLLAELEADRHAAFVTLESDGDVFCEGMDLGELVATGGDVAGTLACFAALLRALGSTPRPVIALVGGPAVGGGVGLAAAADIVLATPRATFGLPEALFGLTPATVFPVIARRVGPPRARWLALGAETISAAEAWRLGLVDELADDLEAALARYARRFDRLAPSALAEVKEMSMLHEAAPADYQARATAGFARLLASADTCSRIERFLAGETPWPDGGAT